MDEPIRPRIPELDGEVSWDWPEPADTEPQQAAAE
jgi:hypothetical protein